MVHASAWRKILGTGLLGATLLLAGCDTRDSATFSDRLQAVGAGGRVAVYDPAWKQGFVLHPGGRVPFYPSGKPTIARALAGGGGTAWIDPARGRLTLLSADGATAATFAVCRYCDRLDESPDGRWLLLRATPGGDAPGIVDPNQMTVLDRATGEAAEFTVGSPPDVIAFYERDGETRLLFFSPGQMAQVKLERLFEADPGEDWKQTRPLSVQVNLSERPAGAVQTAGRVFVLIQGRDEILSVATDTALDLPPVNFLAQDVEQPVALALGPPLAADAETIFPRSDTGETRLLYVLNGNKTISVFNVDNLNRAVTVRMPDILSKPDTLVATPDGRRVLMHQAKGAPSIYRLNVRTGHVVVIPFQLRADEILHAPDGQSSVAIHRGQDGAGDSFTYVNYAEAFSPVELPDRIAEAVMTPDGAHLFLRLENFADLVALNLRTGKIEALDLTRDHEDLPFYPLRIGTLGKGGSLFALLDYPYGSILFHDPAAARTQEQTDFLVDGILDRRGE